MKIKFWLPALLALLTAAGARADDYRVALSPGLALEVWIDDVKSSDPQAWCQPILPLRIVAGKSTDNSQLNGFLPQVGNLLQNQCARLQALPWQLNDSEGRPLASGSALKAQSWRPVVTRSGSPGGAPDTASPALASTAPVPPFTLPGGCRFRTVWDDPAQALFIPDDPALRCNSEGWLAGHSQLSLQQAGKTEPLAVSFIQGYPLTGLQPAAAQLQVVTANSQRLVLQQHDTPDSWLLLTFDAQRHLWAFTGTLLVNSPHADAVTPQQLEALRARWAAMTDPAVKINLLLTDGLHAELADPAAVARRSVN